MKSFRDRNAFKSLCVNVSIVTIMKGICHYHRTRVKCIHDDMLLACYAKHAFSLFIGIVFDVIIFVLFVCSDAHDSCSNFAMSNHNSEWMRTNLN